MRTRLTDRFREYARRTSPWLLVRFIVATVLLAPLWIPILLFSLWRTARWRRAAVGCAFMQRHTLAFANVDASTLQVRPLSGGISNCSLVWQCHDQQGNRREYFVKVFLSVGTLWAWVTPWVSPFPRVHGSRVHERFTVDMTTRTQLAECGVAVARLIAFDPVHCVLVTERLHGEMVNDVLEQVSAHDTSGDGQVASVMGIVHACGAELAKIHAAGFSVVDAQPANCMWCPDEQRVYILDLEYSTRKDKRVWDVAFFLAYLTAQLTGSIGDEVKRAFLVGYRQHHTIDARALTQAGAPMEEFLPVLRAILDLRRFTPGELVDELLRSVNDTNT